MSGSLKYHKVNILRMLKKSISTSYAYKKPTKPPMVFEKAKNTLNSSIMTYIRHQKASRSKRIKVTLPKLPED